MKKEHSGLYYLMPTIVTLAFIVMEFGLILGVSVLKLDVIIGAFCTGLVVGNYIISKFGLGFSYESAYNDLSELYDGMSDAFEKLNNTFTIYIRVSKEKYESLDAEFSSIKETIGYPEKWDIIVYPDLNSAVEYINKQHYEGTLGVKI